MRTHVKLANIFWKLHVFKINILFYHNSIFRKKGYKKQAQMFYQNNSWTFYNWDILQLSNKNSQWKIIGLGIEKSQTASLGLLDSN